VSILNSLSTVTIYDDSSTTNSPQQSFVNWKRNVLSMSVNNPTNTRLKVLPGQTLNVFNGTTATLIDGTSAFSISLNPVLTSTYRVLNTGGTAPGFRTARAVTVNGVAITVAINNNASATFTVGAPTFGSVQAGDTIFIPTALTGDSALNNVFSVLNGGYWTVLSATSTVLTVTRPTGQSFSGTAETVTPTNNLHLQAMSASGVQVGDTVEISAGFSPITRQAFVITAVNPSWVEFISTAALPLETGILPTASGMVFYTKCKRFLRIEVDQNVVLRLNGDTSDKLRISTTQLSTGENFGWFETGSGPCWQLDVVNRSTTSILNIVIMSAE
jgi:hypothetical protein